MKELSRIFSVFVPDVVRWRGMGEGGDRWGKGEEEENGELGEFDEYAANGKKVKRSKGQK